MGEKRKNGITTVGISSLLTIFAVLCMVVFGLLTVSTVRASQTLSDNGISAALDYYQAEVEAEKTLAELRAGIIPDHVRQTDGVFIYEQKISDTQTLAVEVLVEGKSYEILRWQAVSTAEWQTDTQLPVWDGETEEVEP